MDNIQYIETLIINILYLTILLNNKNNNKKKPLHFNVILHKL